MGRTSKSVAGYVGRVSQDIVTVDLELSPTARQTGVAYVHDVELDTGQALAVGDHVRVRDEGGQWWDAAVTAVEEVRLGRQYRLRIERANV